ncbi:MAG: NAD-dependent DNA ligase LigA [Lachnospiraceae bacterium]|nr:NAD-dependent DNA ligase LigA [Lachnospiraceae bacterium]
MDTKKIRIKELVEKLNEASRTYYQGTDEIMSNYEYDKLYDELVALEQETGIVLADSPTMHVGYEVVSNLEKERHEKRMLSLDKTKDVEVLREFIKGQKSILSWKMDGLTVVLTYRDGELFKAVTRGNGEVGEVITPNAKAFKNVPLKIPYKGELIIRGEAIITYEDFKRINDEIPEESDKYKNPRNLCSGSVRQLNSEITAKRSVRMYVFSLVKAEGVDFANSRSAQFDWLKTQGFDVVEHKYTDYDHLAEDIAEFEERIPSNAFPTDGLVVLFDDIAYGESLGTTAKYPKDSMAFKWADEIKETKLREVIWSASRTGLLNPIAVFDTVDLEGTNVSRASVHNVSIVKELALGIGDTITVYKANMIIPQIAENLTRSGSLEFPKICPVCGGTAEIKAINEVESLYCTNPECPAKQIKSFSLMVSRDALNIEGLSEATLEKFIDAGIVKDLPDLFDLQSHRDAIVNMEGFGEKSYDNLIRETNKAKKTTLPKLIYGLGIANVGLSTAKLICREYQGDGQALLDADIERLSSIDKVGPVIAGSFVDYFKDEHNRQRFEKLLSLLEIEEEVREGNGFEGMTFVITGNMEHFDNRNALKDYIEARGGKVSGSVSAKTTYLINNDTTSGSSKNKKAKELGIPIISEEDFLNLG